jgi:hypothetical protein
MKKVLFLLCSFLLLGTSLGVKAQHVTITLSPGWNWVSYTGDEVMTIEAALGEFEPMEGDVISAKSQNTRRQNGQWRGQLRYFTPGYGYMYYSMRNEPVDLVFAVGNSFNVTTNTPSIITYNSAVCGGTVAVPENVHVFLRGLCWGTEPSPDIDGNHTVFGSGPGDFCNTLMGLDPGTVYYVRAYAVSDHGLKYGNVQSFTTENGSADGTPVGAINGKFTIDATGNQVYFSIGNLQYIGSADTPYWKFAENQWDCLGITTGQNNSDPNVDRDLFGWGTSGWNPGNNCYHPWDTYNSTGSFYGPLGANNLTNAFSNSDWGVYNPISNGGNQSNLWRTLTKDEWGYVFNTRTTASGIRFAKAKVNEVNGVILLPDDWDVSYYELSEMNSDVASYSCNTITASEWCLLELHGAVFLPATGYRFGTSVREVGVNGYYWSSSYVNATYSYGMYYLDSSLNPQDCSNRTYGRGVRLVSMAE